MVDIDLSSYPIYPPPETIKIVKARLVDVKEVEGKINPYLNTVFLTVKKPESLLHRAFSYKPQAGWFAKKFCEAMQRSGEPFPEYFAEDTVSHYIGREVLLTIKWETVMTSHWNVFRFTHVRGY